MERSGINEGEEPAFSDEGGKGGDILMMIHSTVSGQAAPCIGLLTGGQTVLILFDILAFCFFILFVT